MSSKAEIESFDTEQLCEFLQQKHKLCDKTIESVKSNLVDGRALFELSSSDLKELEVPLGERKTIQRIVRSHTENVTVGLFLLC